MQWSQNEAHCQLAKPLPIRKLLLSLASQPIEARPARRLDERDRDDSRRLAECLLHVLSLRQLQYIVDSPSALIRAVLVVTGSKEFFLLQTARPSEHVAKANRLQGGKG